MSKLTLVLVASTHGEVARLSWPDYDWTLF